MANWFIGLPLPQVTGLDQALADCPKALRRFHPHDLHVTVAFFGPVTTDSALRAWSSLGDLNGPLTVTLGPLQPFGSRRRPSAFAFELGQGGAAVTVLIAAHRDALRQAAGLAPENRAPRPHVTVARPARNAAAAVYEAAKRWAQTVTPPVGRLVLDRIALYTWAQDRRQRLFDIAAWRSLA